MSPARVAKQTFLLHKLPHDLNTTQQAQLHSLTTRTQRTPRMRATHLSPGYQRNVTAGVSCRMLWERCRT
eukprot:1158517-Pelagomonas_calceolata.AAC.1